MLSFESAPDGTITIAGLTPEEAWLISGALGGLDAEYGDEEARALADPLSAWLTANGYDV